MKRILMLLCVAVVFVTVRAELSDGERAFKEDPAKGIEDAVILNDTLVVDHAFTREMSKHSYKRRMKFFTKKAIDDYGTVKLTYYPGSQNIGDIEGTVYLPDGSEIKLSKADIHKKKLSKEWGSRKVEISIAFPALVEGAVVDYSYYRTYNGLNDVSSWQFQNNLYTVHSEIKFIAWPTLRWGYSMANQLGKVSVDEGRRGDSKFVIISRDNIPPLKSESYSLPDSALSETIYFYYFDTSMKYKDYWKERGKDYYKLGLKKWLKGNRKVKKIIVENNLTGSNSQDTLKKIYYFVLKTFYSIETAPKSRKADLDDKYFRKLGKVNSPDDLFVFDILPDLYIDFAFASLVKSAIPGAKIDFVMYSPWNDSLFNPYINTLQQFDDSMLKITVDGFVYWLSPGKKFLPMNVVDWSAKGFELYVINEKETGFEKIPMDKYSDNISESTVDVYFEEDSVRIEKKEELNRYSSFKLRKSLSFFEEDEVKDLFEESVTDDFGEEAELTAYSLENTDDLEKPLILKTTVEYPYLFEEAGDNYFMELLGIIKYNENRFNNDKRKQVIVFPYSYEKRENVTYHLPEDFTLTSIPKNVAVNKNTFVYTMDFKKLDDSTLQLKTVRRLESSMFSPQALHFFKNSFDQIIAAGAQKIRLEEDL